MKKIAVISTRYITINRFLGDQISELTDAGFSVDCFCNISDLAMMDDEPGIDLKKINFPLSFLSVFNPFRLFSIFLMVRSVVSSYDLIICHTPLASHFVRFFGWGFGSRILYFVHGFRFQVKRQSFSDRVNLVIERLLSAQTGHYFVINVCDFDFVVSEFGTPVTLIKGGVGFDAKRIGLKERIYEPIGSTGALRILVLAAFKIGKGYLEIVDVAKKLNAELFSIDCFGYGDSRWIQQQVSDGQISHVRVHGFDPHIGSRLHDFDVLLCLSEREGLPVSIMEAMASGMVVLASDIRGCRDLIVDGVDGYLVNRKDSSEIVGLLETIRVNHELRSRVGKQAAGKAFALWRSESVAKVFRKKVETIAQGYI